MNNEESTERTSPIAAIGLAFHALLVVPYLLSGLLVPLWMALILWTLWSAILAFAILQRRRRPMIVALLPLVAVTIWLAGVSIGAA